jgi:hypothetical protein
MTNDYFASALKSVVPKTTVTLSEAPVAGVHTGAPAFALRIFVLLKKVVSL